MPEGLVFYAPLIELTIGARAKNLAVASRRGRRRGRSPVTTDRRDFEGRPVAALDDFGRRGCGVMGDEFNERFYQAPAPDGDDALFVDDDASPQIIPARGGDTAGFRTAFSMMRRSRRSTHTRCESSSSWLGCTVTPAGAGMGREWPGNNGRIVLSRIEVAEKCRMNRRTATKALEALKSAGLIEEMRLVRIHGRVWLAPGCRITYLPCIVMGWI